MNLQEVLIQALWLKSTEGWEEPEDNKTRDSQAPECSFYLLNEKKYPQEKPVIIPRLGLEYTIDQHGVVTIKNGKATGGTFIHEDIVSCIESHPDFICAEDSVRRVHPDYDIIQSGHIDIEYIDDTTGKRVRTLVDIKTVGLYVFPGITGTRNMPEYGYTYQKHKSSIIQSNEYATARNVSYYYIMWINRDSWQLKLERFYTNSIMHKEIINKLLDVENCRKKGGFPKMAGIHYCELGKKGDQCYCRHHKNGTTPRDGLPSEKSDANCPGWAALVHAEQFKDLTKIK